MTAQQTKGTEQMSYFLSTRTDSIADLTGMFATCRPMDTKSERRFIREWIEPLDVHRDAAGNLIKRIGDSPVLWSCHTDTVHWKGGTQKTHLSAGGILTLESKSAKTSGCLGADCTAGVFLMREMVRAKVPGLYIFHRGEERGGIGSGYIADKTPELLDGIQMAIAFDRRGKRDVITHQGSRCASDTFASELAESLNRAGYGFDYRPDPSGIFTDTANYTTLIPECTNISVGYEHAHSRAESQDVLHLLKLRDALLGLNVSDLPIVRDVSECDFPPLAHTGNKWRSGWSWQDDYAFESNVTSFANARKPSLSSYDDSDDDADIFDTLVSRKSFKRDPHGFDMRTLCTEYPDVAAELLESLGVEPSELAELVYARTGRVSFP